MLAFAQDYLQADRTADCPHCRKAFRVGTVARSTMCPHCYRGVSFDDVVIKGECSGKVCSGGRVVFRRGSRARTRGITAGEGVEVHGDVEGAVLCRGPVVVSSDGSLRGDVEAASLHVEAGGSLYGAVKIAAMARQ
ncbi:hypothetical protein PHYC_02480 [Phycisphaerales bacterium]|nr:hypothetical protein PHYC_02480 [Phycisphaerales bacterium]